MFDKFSSFASSLSTPPTAIVSIAPDDDANLDQATRALNVAGAGNVRLTTTEGMTETIYVGAGIAFPIRATRIWATGTDATGIKGLY